MSHTKAAIPIELAHDAMAAILDAMAEVSTGEFASKNAHSCLRKWPPLCCKRGRQSYKRAHRKQCNRNFCAGATEQIHKILLPPQQQHPAGVKGQLSKEPAQSLPVSCQ